jgi:adenine-specific DNA-methyltransferase
VRYSLADLGIKVSTGPVVDFRLKEHLRDMPRTGHSAPDLPRPFEHAPGRCGPSAGLEEAERDLAQRRVTEKWLYPNGFYCVVRRFSSKEEKRRVVASVVDPAAFGDHTVLGFENHMNVSTRTSAACLRLLARGLAVFLNTTAVDETSGASTATHRSTQPTSS